MKPFDFKMFVIEYTYRGGKWEIYLPATDYKDALERLQAIEKNGMVFEVVGVIGESGCLTINEN